ncbi:2-amino-4-hydroxy-6-hydroxymethyldihydropteridine diphosphokinase [Rheinheimera texasensis]|uniref:2-amino-4-hydroxy-6- hydroxymethyldihydropteridine diphosphokinase n=1 Tax=Rheinheimera texasensis TaxID=306205 RepID=UPI0032B1C8FA
MARIYISVGSNIDRETNIRGAVRELAQAFGPLLLSSVYESEAVGFVGDAFYNLVVGADTHLDVAAVVSLCKQIEDNYGRVRDGVKYCGRSLDLDLLTYDQLICAEPVELPRAEILHNAFVLQPLAELAPDTLHPSLQQRYAALWQAYQVPQKLWIVPFAF